MADEKLPELDWASYGVSTQRQYHFEIAELDHVVMQGRLLCFYVRSSAGEGYVKQEWAPKGLLEANYTALLYALAIIAPDIRFLTLRHLLSAPLTPKRAVEAFSENEAILIRVAGQAIAPIAVQQPPSSQQVKDWHTEHFTRKK